MGGAASFGQKAATKYKESSRQNAPKKYDDKVLVGSNGTFETSQASQQVHNELQSKEVPLVNMRTGSYRPSKEVTSVQKVEVSSPSGAQNDDVISVAGSEQPSYRGHSKISNNKDTDRNASKEQPEPERNMSKRPAATGNNLTVDMVHGTASKEPPAERGRQNGSSRQEPMSSPRARSNSRRPTAQGEDKIKEARSSSRKSVQRVEIVETDGSGALDLDAEAMRPRRSEKRATTIGLHASHSEARDAILQKRGVNTEDPMGGLSVGMKVMGTGKVGQEMGIGTVIRAGNTPGMVMVRMEESGREMALSVARLQKLSDDKMVKAAEKLVKRVPNRSGQRASTYN